MADKAGSPPRAWQRMLSGRRLDLLDPSPLDVEITDIAHGLARVARWNGQTFGDHRILNFIWVVFGLTICGLPNKVIQVVNPILTAEALDYMEWKHGLRNEALVTTVQGYFQKLATSITSWMSGMVLTWINYIPLTDSLGNAVPQTDPGILSGIWAVFCILPGLARGLYGLSFLFYNIHGDLQQQMIVELAEKRAARLAEQNEKTAD